MDNSLCFGSIIGQVNLCHYVIEQIYAVSIMLHLDLAIKLEDCKYHDVAFKVN